MIDELYVIIQRWKVVKNFFLKRFSFLGFFCKMEKNQELEWAEAQRIEIGVDLVAAAKRQLQFLSAVDRNRFLYEGPSLERAIYR